MTVVTGSCYSCCAPVLHWFCVVISLMVVQDKAWTGKPSNWWLWCYHFVSEWASGTTSMMSQFTVTSTLIDVHFSSPWSWWGWQGCPRLDQDHDLVLCLCSGSKVFSFSCEWPFLGSSLTSFQEPQGNLKSWKINGLV